MILDRGTAQFLRMQDTAAVGNIPTGQYEVYHRAWYGSRTVGIHRFFEARQAGQRVDRIIRILRPPDAEMIWADDVCILHGSEQRYRIVQAQEVKDEESGEECMDISLERMAGIWP